METMASLPQKTLQHNKVPLAKRASAGPGGISVNPPAYGIESMDGMRAEALSLQLNAPISEPNNDIIQMFRQPPSHLSSSPVVQRILAEDLMENRVRAVIAGEHHGEIPPDQEKTNWLRAGVTVVHENEALPNSERMPDPPILRAAHLWNFFYRSAAPFWDSVLKGEDVSDSRVTMDAHRSLAESLQAELEVIGLGSDLLLTRAYDLLDKLVVRLPADNDELMEMPWWKKEILAKSKQKIMADLYSVMYNIHRGGSFGDVSFEERPIMEERSREMLRIINEAGPNKTIYKVGDEHISDMKRLKLKRRGDVIVLDRSQYLIEYGNLGRSRLVGRTGNQDVFNSIGNKDL